MSAASAVRFARAFTQKTKKARPFILTSVGLSAAYSSKKYLPSPTDFVKQLLAEGIVSSIPDRYDKQYIINNLCIPAIREGLDEFIDEQIQFQYLRDILHKEARELFIDIDKIIKSQVPIKSTKKPNPEANPDINPFLQAATSPLKGVSHSLGNSLRGSINKIKTNSTASQLIADLYCKPFMKRVLINIASNIKVNNPELANSMDRFIHSIDSRHESEPELKGGSKRRKKSRQRKTRKVRS